MNFSDTLFPPESERSAAERLQGIAWDFRKAATRRGSIHSFHSYPARFIPEIPRSVLTALPPAKDSLIFDPFSGCGTTLVEAQHAGYESIGVDLNPIGCLITRVKTTPLPTDFLVETARVLNSARNHRDVLVPEIPNLFHWFQKDVCDALAALKASFVDLPEGAIKQALEAVFSSIVVRVSNQDSDTRYAAVAKDVSRETVFQEFERAAETFAVLAANIPDQPRPQVLNQSIFDTRATDFKKPVGLVVTSPPYPNAYEYWLYHKYRMWWLGYDPINVKANEIGARAHFFSGRRREEENFDEQMSKVFALLSDVMLPGGFCCFVVGDSKIHGNIIDNAEILNSAAAKHGFKLAFRTDREINPHRKSFNLHHARIKREHVLVWER